MKNALASRRAKLIGKYANVVLFAVAFVVAWCTLSLLNSVKETLFTKTTLTTLFAQIYLKTYFTFNNWKQQKLTDTSLQTFWE